MQLSNQQKETITGCIQQIEKHQEVAIAGLAGTGKTTILAHLIDYFKDNKKKYVVLTPTGKAANVLRSKGVKADTIHSAIYNYKGKYVCETTGNEFLGWEEKEEIEGTPDYCIIDEASMVDDKLATDLRNLGMKIIWVGDNGQLPPVGKDPGIMRHPDFVLKEIFRQKGNSGLIDFAYDVRAGELKKEHYDNVDFVQGDIKQLVNLKFDQAICGFNKTRINFNIEYRKAFKLNKKIINVGEKMICVHNNRRLGIFNGMQFEVTNVLAFEDLGIRAEVKLDTGITKEVLIRRDALNNVNYESEGMTIEELLADYAYCITCHKSQGSEFETVLVFNQECQAWDQKRWLYTAATRAKKNLIIV